MPVALTGHRMVETTQWQTEQTLFRLCFSRSS
nr:MAG TPA_asm: hypothetical protein [Caudoviricetes sp.]